jgi:hypothetical protein
MLLAIVDQHVEPCKVREVAQLRDRFLNPLRQNLIDLQQLGLALQSAEPRSAPDRLTDLRVQQEIERIIAVIEGFTAAQDDNVLPMAELPLVGWIASKALGAAAGCSQAEECLLLGLSFLAERTPACPMPDPTGLNEPTRAYRALKLTYAGEDLTPASWRLLRRLSPANPAPVASDTQGPSVYHLLTGLRQLPRVPTAVETNLGAPCHRGFAPCASAP